MESRVLVVGLDREHYQELLPLLSRSLLSVDRISSGESAVELAERVPLSLIVARHPLPDMAIGSFMQRIHAPGSRCDSTPILFLADENRLAEIRALLPGGARQAISVDDPAAVLREAGALLKLAPRAEVRVPVRLQVKLGGAPPISCTSENLSENGLLLKSSETFPLGARVSFEVALPGERTPLQGEAEVMRHTEPDVEGVVGMGLRVIGFKAGGAARLRRFIASQ